MKGPLALAVAVATLVVAIGLWRGPKTPAPEAPVPSPVRRASVAPAETAPAVRPSGERRARFARPVPPTKASPSPEMYRKYVPFRVVDGMAVAYGDILLGAVEEGTPEEGFHEPGPIRLWEEREIPYGIATSLPQPERVEDALRYLAKHTPLVFVPLIDQPDGIVFEPGKEHCLSALGKTGGRQPIRLAPDCGRTEILHEILHALGFLHEHSRHDRDRHVEVLWDNVDPRFRDQFRVAPETLDDPARGTPFDANSVMLYPPTLFAKAPGLVTLRSRDDRPIAPVRDGLSRGDVQRIRDVYR